MRGQLLEELKAQILVAFVARAGGRVEVSLEECDAALGVTLTLALLVDREPPVLVLEIAPRAPEQ